MISVADLKAQLGEEVELDEDYAEYIVLCVNSKVNQWHGYKSTDVWSNSHKFGAMLLAATLYRRRNSPAGISDFNEMGQVYVQKFDPHVSMLLGLGGWGKPKVG